MLDDIPLLTYLIIVFLVSMFFSFIYWLETNVESMTKDNRIKKMIRGISHSAIGAFIGISAFIGLGEFYPEVSRLMGTVVAGLFAIMVDVVLFIVKKKGESL